MDLNILAEVWRMAKDSIISTDVDHVADNMITILIDNDYDVADIKAIFRDDKDIMSALNAYVDTYSEEDEELDSEYEEDDHEDDAGYNADDWN